MLPILFSLGLLAAIDDPTVRMSRIQKQFEDMQVIETREEFREEREKKISFLRDQLEKNPELSDEITALYWELDRTRQWLLDHAVEVPSMPEGSFEETGDEWTARAPGLSVHIRQDDLSITFETPEWAWVTHPSDGGDVLFTEGRSFGLASAGTRKAEAFHTGYSIGMLITLSDFPEAPEFEFAIRVAITGSEVTFDFTAVKDPEGLLLIRYPKPVRMEGLNEEFSVLPVMQGLLLPGDYKEEFRREELMHSRTFYMPWWGQIRGSFGIQTLVETSHDAGGLFDHPEGGPTSLQLYWFSSLGRLRYPRIVRYVLDSKASHVSMAKRYRRHVRETGRLFTLEQKRLEVPNLDRVIGQPVIHVGALYHNVQGSRFDRADAPERNHRILTFREIADSLRELKERGLDTAYVHLDGWGFRGYDNLHPDVIPPGPLQGGWEGLRHFADTCEELDYLFAVHDQYRDYYLDAVSFDERMTVRNRDGNRDEHAEWAGGRQTYLSPRFAPGYVRRNHDALLANGVKLKGAYLDVFAVVPLEESFSKTIPITRTDCAKYRSECCDLLKARGYVVSSEEPADYLIPSIHLVHHGPYSTSPKGYGPGERIGTPVPLFNLVYNDCLLTPWPMSENGGWGIPNGDSGRLHCILNAGLPYVGPGANPEQIRKVKEAAAVAARLGTQEMTNHEFLDEARRIQRTTFADGTTVTVDFAAGTWEIHP